ncbi:MAG TPA: ferritin-like domain-containing protein [Solirubrobacterales bacterium]|nr:ferritin-like domain-containing protein [Solirubrobacterales bacterium]
MAPNRIISGGAMLAALLIVGILAGCGGGGSSTAKATEAASGGPSTDAALLDKVLARQEAAVGAFAAVGPALPPRLARMAAYFRAQEQEHVDAVLKALRGLGSPAEPSPEPLDASGLKTDRERLVFLYEVESATIDEELSAISKLEATWPRSLLASTVADQAQHLTLLRRALGAGPLASIPVPFENGTAPPPE